MVAWAAHTAMASSLVTSAMGNRDVCGWPVGGKSPVAVGWGHSQKASCNPLPNHRPSWIFKSAPVQLVVTVDGCGFWETPHCAQDGKG